MPRPTHTRVYETDEIAVHWESARCIHTALCLRALPTVFDVNRRPWVKLSAADADAIAAAVERCPTGALRYERCDGAEGEVPARPATVLPIPDGPLMLAGDLQVETPDGEVITRETRLTLCRCGRSRNQPFCDNSHIVGGFDSGEAGPPHREYPPPREGAETEPLRVIPTQDGSIELRGHVRVVAPGGEELVEAGRVWLCRCGQSAHKPFCDGSHQNAGFRSRDAEIGEERLEAETPAAFTPNPGVPPPPDA